MKQIYNILKTYFTLLWCIIYVTACAVRSVHEEHTQYVVNVYLTRTNFKHVFKCIPWLHLLVVSGYLILLSLTIVLLLFPAILILSPFIALCIMVYPHIKPYIIKE